MNNESFINDQLLDANNTNYLNAASTGDIITASTDLAGNLLTLIPKKSDLDKLVKTKCGRKPLVFIGIGKDKKRDWEDCRDNTLAEEKKEREEAIRNQQLLMQNQNTNKPKGIGTLKIVGIVGISLVIVTGIVFLIYKLRTKKTN